MRYALVTVWPHISSVLMHQFTSLLSNHKQTKSLYYIQWSGLHWMPSATPFTDYSFLLSAFFKSRHKYKLYSLSHLYHRHIQSNHPALHCNDITLEIERKQPIYASAILSINGMWRWLDLHKTIDKHKGLVLWPHLISIWQSEVAVTMLHVYSKLTFIMAQCLTCIFVPCCMQIFMWMAVIRMQELMLGGLRRLIYCPLFRRKWASYTSNRNKRWTAQLKPTSKASLSACLLLSLKTKREGEDSRGGAVCSGFFGEFPWLPRCYFRVISVYWHWNAFWILNGVQFVFDRFAKLKWHCYFCKWFLCHCCKVRMRPH